MSWLDELILFVFAVAIGMSVIGDLFLQLTRGAL